MAAGKAWTTVRLPRREADSVETKRGANVRESKVEKHLRLAVERRGGTCEKFVSPGRRGVPDRIISDRRDHVIFVETKAPTGKLKSWQERDHARRRARGFHVYTLYTIEQVDVFMMDFYGHD